MSTPKAQFTCRCFAMSSVALVALLLWQVHCPTVALAGPGKGFLWLVEGQQPVYLLGSIHVAEPKLYPLAEEIDQAFAAAQVLVVEADVIGLGAAKAARLLVERGTLPPGERLEARLSPETLHKLKARQVDLGRLGAMRPWSLAMALQSAEMARLGYDSGLGVDRHFLRRARERGMVVEEMEGLEAQFALFAEMDQRTEEAFLNQALDELDAAASTARTIVESWRLGDVQALEQAIFTGLDADPDTAGIYERIFFARNQAMAQRIEGYLRGDRAAFVVLGAGHMVGERSVVALLRHKGYTVRDTDSERPDQEGAAHD